MPAWWPIDFLYDALADHSCGSVVARLCCEETAGKMNTPAGSQVLNGEPRDDLVHNCAAAAMYSLRDPVLSGDRIRAEAWNQIQCIEALIGE